ncbi:MAG: hypothetical protein A2Y79_13020 [Deltaproteobacteria bacterium RBG_13_43_22]|nr:MAG: hypothetical protein A2Y79_13020 [Deltaproteobacteria bacterium RBG_13_43_22]
MREEATAFGLKFVEDERSSSETLLKHSLPRIAENQDQLIKLWDINEGVRIYPSLSLSVSN